MVFEFALQIVDFYFSFYVCVPKTALGTASCRTVVTTEKEQRILQVCRNLNTNSVLPVKCSKSLIFSSVELHVVILGSLFRLVSSLFSCCRLRKRSTFAMKVKNVAFEL